MKASTKSLHGILAMANPDGPETEEPEPDDGDGAKGSDALKEVFENAKAGDWEGAHSALRAVYKSFEAEDEDEETEEEPEEAPEPEDEE
jgi:hypothetical protein